MPKGKSRAKNPELYKDDGEARQQRQAVPQAASHRRGGTHRVKEEHLTHTHWDQKNYLELMTAAKDAKVWRKDMSKPEMAKRLAAKDEEDRKAAYRAKKEFERKKKEMEEKQRKEAEEKERLKKEKEERRRSRRRRRAAGEEASSSSAESEEPLDDNVGFGQIISDDEEDESSTTTTMTHAILSPIAPAQKLRIFEWQYSDPPPDSPTSLPISPSSHMQTMPPELLPKKIPYAAMNVVTTVTRQTLWLPGRGIPDELGPDFVPTLSENTKDCAHNGVLVGPLQHAIVERAADWAIRTQVQWWNGRMYFYLPPRKSKASLANVYSKWKKKKDSRAKTSQKKGSGITKLEPKKKAEQKLKDRREKMLDVYAASEYRPPICYVPSYLDYPLLDDDEEVEKSLDNLFYIRFINSDLPHYFFWADPDEWEDPTTQNPHWVDTEPYNEPTLSIDQRDTNRQDHLTPLRKDIPPSIPLAPAKPTQIRRKKTPVPHKFSASAMPPKASKYKVALWAIEKDIYHNGWANTMYVLRDKWLRENKGKLWTQLISELIKEYPSGNLPATPPVHPRICGGMSIAEKLATVDVPNAQRPWEPIRGDEDWTRDDDAYWVTVDIPNEKHNEDVEEELLRSIGTPTEPQALHRRRSEVFAWMDDLDSHYWPPPASSSISPLSDSPSIRAAEREAWEERFMQHVEAETALATEIEQMPVAELKHSLYNIMNERRRSLVQYRCPWCYASLDTMTQGAYEAHFSMHRDSANELCPFCNYYWSGWGSEMKAAHIFYHDMDDVIGRKGRRSSINPSEIGILYAMPMAKRMDQKDEVDQGGETRLRRPSKVHFSPIIVEKRVAYNDIEDEDVGMDADVSSIATSPHRSSLRKFTTTARPKPQKPATRIDTTLSPIRVTRSRKGNNEGNSSGSRRRHKKPTAPKANYQDASSLPAHIISPELRISKHIVRYPDNHPDAAWNPGRHSSSGSEHVSSPVLPRRKVLPPKHPDAPWDPRRLSKSSFESLEWYTGRKGPRKTTGVNREVMGKVIKAGNTKNTTRKSKEKADEVDYEDVPSSASSYQLATIYTKRGKAQDLIYHTNLPSPASTTSSRSPKIASTKRKRASCPAYHNKLAPSPQHKKRRRTSALDVEIGETPQAVEELAPSNREKDTHQDSTMSNVSLASDSRRSSALERPGLELEVIEKLASKKGNSAAPKRTRSPKLSKIERLGSQNSKVLRKEKTINAEPKGNKGSFVDLTDVRLRDSASSKRNRSTRSATALSRHNSSAQPDVDYIPFGHSPFLEDHSSDVLTGNPFAVPPKRSRIAKTKTKTTPKERKTLAKEEDRPKVREVQSTAKATAPREYSIAIKKARKAKQGGEAIEPAACRAAQNSKKETILGQPYVEPLIIAPTRRLSKSKRGGYSVNRACLDLPTASPKASPQATKKKATLKEGNGERGRRSSAPTPSPSLANSTHRNSNANIRSKEKAKASPLPIDMKATTRKASYDIPFSDARPIVPPNTPATGLLKNGGYDENDEGSSETPLDAGKLSDKIGKVKTTRRGLVRELPVGVKESVLAKGKARGRSVSQSR